MPTEIKIALFFIAIRGSLEVLKRNPGSIAAQWAFAWQGPYPQDGERLSSYYRRKVKFALGWLLELLFVGAVLGISAWWVPVIKNAEKFLMFSMFALSLGVGMAMLGALLVFLASLKAKWIGPDPIFSSAINPPRNTDDE